MRTVLITLLLLICLGLRGQNIQGLWYNKKFDVFYHVVDDEIAVIDKWDYRYHVSDHGLKIKEDKFVVVVTSYRTGLIFWKQTSKTRFSIVRLTGENLILKKENRKDKKEESEYVFVRVSEEFYKKRTGYEMHKFK